MKPIGPGRSTPSSRRTGTSIRRAAKLGTPSVARPSDPVAASGRLSDSVASRSDRAQRWIVTLPAETCSRKSAMYGTGSKVWTAAACRDSQ